MSCSSFAVAGASVLFGSLAFGTAVRLSEPCVQWSSSFLSVAVVSCGSFSSGVLVGHVICCVVLLSAAGAVCFSVHLFKLFLTFRGVWWAHATILSTFFQMQEYVHHVQSVHSQILVHVRFHLFPYVVIFVHNCIIGAFLNKRNFICTKCLRTDDRVCLSNPHTQRF